MPQRNHNGVPLPHLATVLYLHSPRKRSCSYSRPEPPTPRKMMSHGVGVAVPMPRQTRRRSLIPTPSAGTSRRSSPSIVPQDKPLPGTPRSESMLPYTERTEPDLSGFRQQLDVRHYSIKSLKSPAEIAIQPSQQPLRPALPKSKTSASLASRHRTYHAIVDRSLLKPLGPPLPHSLSTGNVSCFSGDGPSPSPIKLPAARGPGRSARESPVTVIDAIRESRMTDHEIAVLKQVQKDASRNKERLRTRSVSDRQTSTTSSSRKSYPSGSSLAAPGRSKDVQESVTPVRESRKKQNYLVINTKLANAAPVQPVHGDTGNATKQSERKEPAIIDPRFIYFEQHPSYWTGRFSTICDKLRNKAMLCALANGSLRPVSADPSNQGSYEVEEQDRVDAALDELRGYCKTAQALRSFEEFEETIRQALSLNGKPNECCQIEEEISKTQVDQATHKSTSSIKAEASIVVPPRRMRTDMPFPSIFGRLAKSKTVGDISAVTDEGTSEPRKAKRQSTTARLSLSRHDRQASSDALPTRVSRPAPVSQRKLFGSTSHSRFPSSVSSAQSIQTQVPSQPETPKRPSACHCKTSSFGSDRFDTVAEGVTASIMESGHGQPPAAAEVKSPRTKVYMIDGEKVVRSRHNRERRSSGDVMKEFWQAGVTQVRKMGRRVGGSSAWMTSSEDLSAVVSPRSARKA